MKKKLKQHQYIIQAVITLFIAGISALEMVGKPARLVMILTVAAACVGAGINIGMLVQKKRQGEGKSLSNSE